MHFRRRLYCYCNMSKKQVYNCDFLKMIFHVNIIMTNTTVYETFINILHLSGSIIIYFLIPIWDVLSGQIINLFDCHCPGQKYLTFFCMDFFTNFPPAGKSINKLSNTDLVPHPCVCHMTNSDNWCQIFHHHFGMLMLITRLLVLAFATSPPIPP